MLHNFFATHKKNWQAKTNRDKFFTICKIVLPMGIGLGSGFGSYAALLKLLPTLSELPNLYCTIMSGEYLAACTNTSTTLFNSLNNAGKHLIQNSATENSQLFFNLYNEFCVSNNTAAEVCLSTMPYELASVQRYYSATLAFENSLQVAGAMIGLLAFIASIAAIVIYQQCKQPADNESKALLLNSI